MIDRPAALRGRRRSRIAPARAEARDFTPPEDGASPGVARRSRGSSCAPCAATRASATRRPTRCWSTSSGSCAPSSSRRVRPSSSSGSSSSARRVVRAPRSQASGGTPGPTEGARARSPAPELKGNAGAGPKPEPPKGGSTAEIPKPNKTLAGRRRSSGFWMGVVLALGAVVGFHYLSGWAQKKGVMRALRLGSDAAVKLARRSRRHHRDGERAPAPTAGKEPGSAPEQANPPAHLVAVVDAAAAAPTPAAGAPAALDAGRFPLKLPQVVQSSATDMAPLNDLDLLDAGRVQREDALDADAVGDLADRERRPRTAPMLTNHDPLEHLDPLLVALPLISVCTRTLSPERKSGEVLTQMGTIDFGEKRVLTHGLTPRGVITIGAERGSQANGRL